MNIKDMVKNGKQVKFVKYHNLELWYVTECGFEFPIPISPSETGEAIFLAEDKAMLFMRWIKKHIDNINKAKVEQS